MFDPHYKEARVHPHISSVIADAHSADLRAAADRRRATAVSRTPHVGRLRSAWRARRAAPNPIGGARAA